jgi:hypothetical protein
LGAKPHFINPCCFGEDFAAWLKQELAPLAAHGFDFSEPMQEDYGWAFGLRTEEILSGSLCLTSETAFKKNLPNGLSRLAMILA